MNLETFKNRPLKAVFFDMDGVIYDSMGNHAEAWCKAFEYFGVDFPAEMAYMNEGRTAASTINLIYQRDKNRAATPEEITAIYSKKTELFEQLPPSKKMEGIEELMTVIQENGIEIWVVTGSAQERLLEGLVKEFGRFITRERVISGLDVKHGKPHPEPYLMALKKSGFPAAETMVIENAPLGVESAKGAGITTLVINSGILPDSVLLDSGGDSIFSHHHEIASLFRK